MNNNLYKSSNINDLIKLIDIICKELKLNKPTYIWDICNKYKNYSLDILNANKGYKKEYHIHSLFIWFKSDSLFTISYKIIKSCLLCFKYTEQNVQLDPLVSITIDKLNSWDNFIDILYNKLKLSNTLWENCFYDKDKKIKISNIFHNCMKNIIASIEMPYFLFFEFELSNENDINQFRNLKKYRDIITNI